MAHRTARGGSGPRLPEKIDDYTRFDPYAATMSLDVLRRILGRYGSRSDFLRAHMRDPGAPACIQGDPDDRKSFYNAKRALSDRLGERARVIAEWELVEFVLTRCPSPDDHAARPRLAGLWRASQRYDPPGYRGPVHVPDGAPPPYTDIAEAPNDAVRVQMLVRQLSDERDKTAEAERELKRRFEGEKWLIRMVTDQQKQLELVSTSSATSSATRELLADNARLRRELDEMREWYTHRERRIRTDLMAKLQREQAAHHLTANRMAVMTAMFDAVRDDSDATPGWLRHADFPLGMDLHALLKRPDSLPGPRSGEPEHVAQRRFLTVLVRTYLITMFGQVPDREDDPAGLYRAIVRDGVLPPVDVLRRALSAHTLMLQFALPLLDTLASTENRALSPVSVITPKLDSDDDESTREESTQAPADVHELEVRGGDHRPGVPDKPVNALDLVNALKRGRRPVHTA